MEERNKSSVDAFIDDVRLDSEVNFMHMQDYGGLYSLDTYPRLPTPPPGLFPMAGNGAAPANEIWPLEQNELGDGKDVGGNEIMDMAELNRLESVEQQQRVKQRDRIGVRVGQNFKHRSGANKIKSLRRVMGQGLEKMEELLWSKQKKGDILPGFSKLKLEVQQEETGGVRGKKEELTLRLSLQKEKNKFEKRAEEQRQELDKTEKIIHVLSQIETENSSGTLTLESLASYLSDLKRRLSKSHWVYYFSSIAFSLACPLFKRVFDSWDDPLQNPSHELELVSAWKNMLHTQQSVYSGYTQLVSEAILPAGRISRIYNCWDAREPAPMLKFLECWKKLLPSSVLDTLLETAVIPKLSSLVNSWNPSSETDQILALVQSWLLILGKKSIILYQMVHIKLGDVLDAWHPSQNTARTILSPWRDVFDSPSWVLLMSRYIVPKLQVTLQELEIHPEANNKQNLDQFNWVMAWASDIPIHFMVDLLSRFFFTKWLQVLYNWLVTAPDFEEIRKWYLGWKELLPQEILGNESIRARLGFGLDMISKASDGAKIERPGYLLDSGNPRELRQRQQSEPYDGSMLHLPD